MQIYKTEGVCSSEIRFEVEDEILKSVTFIGGCRGNLTAISRLISGMPIEDVISKLKGISCRPNGASCADQLVQALERELRR